MKTFASIIILLVTITLIVAHEDDDSLFDQMVTTCAKNHSITTEIAWDLIESERDAANENEECFATCVGINLSLLNTSDKKLNVTFINTAPEYLAKDKIPGAITKCGALVGKSDCDTGYKQIDCLFNEAGVDSDESKDQ